MRIVIAQCVVLTIAAGLVAPAKAESGDVHVQLTIVQPGLKGGIRQTEFSKQARPGPHRELKLLMAAEIQAAAVALPFNREGRLAYESAPEIAHLAMNSKQEIPAEGKWTFEGPENLAEIDVVLAGPDTPDFEELAKLIHTMKLSPAASPLHRQQLGALHRWLDAHSQRSSTAADYTVKAAPAEIAGMVRGDVAGQAVPLSPNSCAVVRIRIE